MKSEQHQLMVFYQKACNDGHILPSDMSLYFAIYWQWVTAGCPNSIFVYRKELIVLARINSLATYHKCIKDLNDFGYIIYRPTYNYYRGSEIFIFNL